ARSSKREGIHEERSHADAWEARRHAPTSEGTINGRRIDSRRARCTEESGREPEVPGRRPKGARGGPSGSGRQNRGRPPGPRAGTDLALGRAGLARRARERPEIG